MIEIDLERKKYEGRVEKHKRRLRELGEGYDLESDIENKHNF
jgi:hypothetical protein